MCRGRRRGLPGTQRHGRRAAGLDVVYGGLVPAGWEDPVALGAEAIPEGGPPGDMFDFDPANNFAMDVDLPSGIFVDGFESGDTSAWTATGPD